MSNKRYIFLSVLVLILASIISPIMVNSAKYILGNNKIGEFIGIGNLPLLGDLNIELLGKNTITLHYTPPGEATKISLIDPSSREMYTLNTTIGYSYQTLLPSSNDNIIEIMSTLGGLLNPIPRTTISIVTRDNNLVKAWEIKQALVDKIEAYEINNGYTILVLHYENGLLIVTLSDSSINVKNITDLEYDNIDVKNGKVYIYTSVNGEASTIIYNPANDEAMNIHGKVYVYTNDYVLLWLNDSLILKTAEKTYVISDISSTLDVDMHQFLDYYVIVLIYNDNVKILVIDSDNDVLYEYNVEATYTSLNEVKPYTLFKAYVDGYKLYIVYGVESSNALLQAIINLSALASTHDKYYMNALDYPSKQTKSIIEVTRIAEKQVSTTTYEIQESPITLSISNIQPDETNNYINLVKTAITTISINIISPEYIVETPSKTMSYGDYELMGLTYSIQAKLPTGLGYEGVHVELKAVVYVDNEEYKTIEKSGTTNQQGMLTLKITKDEINATGDLLIKWTLTIDEYVLNGTISIPYPFQRPTTGNATNTTTTSPIPPPPTTQTTTTPAGGGTTTTQTPSPTQPGETTTTTTQPSGGNTLLIAAVVVIIIIIAVAGFLFLRRR